MSTEPEYYFYGRGRLFYAFLYFALAPLLLYLFGLWSLPPTWLHGAGFLAAAGAGVCYVVYHWRRPQLTLEADRVDWGETVLFKDLAAMKPARHAIKLVVNTERGVEVKTLGLAWASRGDARKILQRLSERLQQGNDED